MIDVAVMNELHAARDRVGHIGEERSLLRIVRTPFATKSGADAVADIQIEVARRNAESFAAALEKTIVVVDLFVDGRMNIDPRANLIARRRHVETGDAVVGR